MSTKYRASLISHTHWDREWYAPFQVFRMRLVGLLDELIEKMEADPRYRFFHFDGQTILFEDYLEIRPEMAPRLRALCQAGRIISGPMYVSPDESLPGAETHVRNFLLGFKQEFDHGRLQLTDVVFVRCKDFRLCASALSSRFFIRKIYVPTT